MSRRYRDLVLWGLLVLPLAACGGTTQRAGQQDPPSHGGAGPGIDDPEPQGQAAAPPALMSFSTDEAFVGIGLWMGTQVGSSLPVAPSDDAEDTDGQALHLSGDADDRGADTYWHIGTALDRIYARVLFRAKTERPEGQPLIIALAGSSSSDYFGDLQRGRPWQAVSVEVTSEWRDFEFAFAAFQPLGPGEPAPTFEPPWSAVHLIMAPNAPFDLWLSYFELRSDR